MEVPREVAANCDMVKLGFGGRYFIAVILEGPGSGRRDVSITPELPPYPGGFW